MRSEISSLECFFCLLSEGYGYQSCICEPVAQHPLLDLDYGEYDFIIGSVRVATVMTILKL